MKKSFQKKSKKMSNGKFEENSKLTRGDDSCLSGIIDTQETSEEMKKRIIF